MPVLRLALRFCLPALLAGTLWAQVYPGQYPPGQYPGQIPLPLPRIPTQIPSGQGRRGDTKIVHAGGVVDKVTSKYFSIKTPQNQSRSFQYSSRTQFTRDGQPMDPADLQVGDRVRIDAEQDQYGWLIANNVMVEPRDDDSGKASPPRSSGKKTSDKSGQSSTGADDKQAGTAGQPQDTSVERVDTGASKAPPPDTGDEGPPVIRRGAPPKTSTTAQKRTAPSSTSKTSQAPAPAQTASTSERPTIMGGARQPLPPLDPREALIGRARNTAQTTLGKMPNFVSTQVTTRYASRSSGRSWEPMDVVSAEVVYEEGKETYRNIKVDGRPVNKSMEQIGGATSTGEYATILADLFSSGTDARFTYRREDVQTHLPASVYDFAVSKPNSHWEIHAEGGASTMPAYKGAVWVDKDSARVLRIEMQAVGLNEEGFPLDTVETTLDYDFVLLAGQRYLLPVRSESLSCQRGTPYCSRNTLDFRNYHVFTGQSTVTFDK